MKTFEEDDQLCLFDPDIWYGKMYPEPSLPESPRARTSGLSSRKLLELKYQVFQSLDLTPGAGNLLGEFYWELISPWHGDALMLNTGVSPREEKESSLSQILQPDPPRKYFLSPKACLGILRRAFERGKELPYKLKRALQIQSGVIAPDGQPTGLDSYHINQRDEGIDLHGKSGALMATNNMQMQTFVTQPDGEDQLEGFDGYNGDLTSSVSATLGTNCGMSTGRNGILRCVGIDSKHACTTGDIANTLATNSGSPTSRNGVLMQYSVTPEPQKNNPLHSSAAGFCAEASSDARGIGYQEECSPTLKSEDKGPSIICLNDQGGQRMDVTHEQTTTLRAQAGGHQPLVCLNDQGGGVMDCSVEVTGTLRAEAHGHQPLVYENHGIDSRYTGPHKVVPTMSARYGTGGNNLPLVDQESVICITGNAIDRQPHNGGNGIGYQEDIAYTLTATDHHAVFSRQRVDVFKDDSVASTQSAKQHKDATDLVMDAEVFGQSQFGNYSPGCTTLRAQGGDNGGGSENLVAQDNVPSAFLIRRLTPLECERLQGFPDGWTDIEDASDSSRYKALGNSVAIPCVEYILHGLALALKAK